MQKSRCLESGGRFLDWMYLFGCLRLSVKFHVGVAMDGTLGGLRRRDVVSSGPNPGPRDSRLGSLCVWLASMLHRNIAMSDVYQSC